MFKSNKVKRAKNHIEKFIHEASKNPKVYNLVRLEAKARGILDEEPPNYKERLIYYEKKVRPNQSIESLPRIEKTKQMYNDFIDEDKLYDY